MPLPMTAVEDAEWASAPTAYRLVVGDADLRLRDTRPAPEGFEIAARLRRINAHVAQTRRARRILTTVFGVSDPILQASTTRVVVDLCDGGPTIHLLGWDGAGAIVASYDHDGRESYALGRIDGGEILWTHELRLGELAERFDRGHHAGSRFGAELDRAARRRA